MIRLIKTKSSSIPASYTVCFWFVLDICKGFYNKLQDEPDGNANWRKICMAFNAVFNWKPREDGNDLNIMHECKFVE